MDQGSAVLLERFHFADKTLAQLIPEPTTCTGEAFNLHNAGSGISTGHEKTTINCGVTHNL